MKRILLTILSQVAMVSSLGILLPAHNARAVSGGGHYTLPLQGCDFGTYQKCFISAYYDNNKANGTTKDYNCGTKTYDNHSGTDFTGYGIRGRNVIAAADGEVTYTNDGCADQNTSTGSTCGGGYGNYVRIRNTSIGQDVVYAHMMKGSVAVKQGQKVSRGTVLGKVASSGSSTGAHLHFDIRPISTGTRFDPYKGSCNSAITASQWVTQNGYKQLPSDKVSVPDPPDPPTPPPAPVDASSMTGETVADGSEFAPSASFTKTWTVKNTGNTTWTAANGYALSATGGTTLSGTTNRVALGGGESIAPGGSKTWSVSMTAPILPGTYTQNWRMTHNETQFGTQLSAKIKVMTVNGAELTSETVPAGAEKAPKETFTKTWTVKNTGNTTWTAADGYALSAAGGTDLSGTTTTLALGGGESIAPGGSKTWSVSMTAPILPGTYTQNWSMTQRGTTFGARLSAKITVVAFNEAELVSETLPTGVQKSAQEMFIKTWTVKNTGNTTWDPTTGYHLALISGTAMGASAPLLLNAGETIPPGGTKEWMAILTAPYTPGPYQAIWQMEQAGVGAFGPPLKIDVVVPRPNSNSPSDPSDPSDYPVVVTDGGTPGRPDAGTVGRDAGADLDPDNPTEGDWADGGFGFDPSLAEDNMFSIISSGGCQSSDLPLSPNLATILLLAGLIALRRRGG